MLRPIACTVLLQALVPMIQCNLSIAAVRAHQIEIGSVNDLQSCHPPSSPSGYVWGHSHLQQANSDVAPHECPHFGKSCSKG
eukprot:1142687-Pelagomonas_calceolata.AAC.1